MLAWYLDGERLSKTDIEMNNKKFVLFGADIKRNEQLFKEVNTKDILYIFENNEKKWGTYQEGIEIVEPFKVIEDVVLISGIHDWDAISVQAKEMGYQNIFFFLTEDVEAALGKYIAEFSPSVYENSIRQDQKFKYIHFISDEKFFSAVIEYIEYGLDVREHFFVVYNMNGANRNNIYGVWDKYKELSRKYHNIYLHYYECCRLNLVEWEKNRGKLDCLLEKAEKMIFHGEAVTPSIYEYLLEKIHLIKKKGVLLLWSGDVGRDEYTRPIIEQVFQYVRMIPYSYGIDKETVLKYFPMMRNAIWLKSNVSYARLTEYTSRKEETTKNVLIAHSPHSYTKAKETMQYLSGIQQSIHIYCVTSYGEKDIIEEIGNLGRKLFGSCFHAVNKYMDYKEYVYFLSQMDLAVFGMELLSGRDTLELLFWLEKKVYMKHGSVACRRMEAAGYRVSDYYTAKNEIINGAFDNVDRERNHSIAENEFNPERKLEQWRELYEYDF